MGGGPIPIFIANAKSLIVRHCRGQDDWGLEEGAAMPPVVLARAPPSNKPHGHDGQSGGLLGGERSNQTSPRIHHRDHTFITLHTG
jgi:hypothetical protein